MSGNLEGDLILINAYRQVGCIVPDDILTIAQLTPELLIGIVSKCVNLISNGSLETPSTLGSNIAARHRVCTDVASKVKSLGCNVDCGYNQLLYPVETQTRNLLTWLLSKLPRIDGDDDNEILSVSASFDKQCKNALKDWQNEAWLLPHAYYYSIPRRNIYQTKPLTTASSNLLINKNIKGIYNWCNKYKISPVSSLFEIHSLELAEENDDNLLDALEESLTKNNKSKIINKSDLNKKRDEQLKMREMLNMSFDDLVNSLKNSGNERNRFNHALRFGEEEISGNLGQMLDIEAVVGESPEDLQKRREQDIHNKRQQELLDLKAALDEYTNLLSKYKNDEEMAQKLIEEISINENDLKSKVEDLQKQVNIAQQAADMLPKAEENLKKLQLICDAANERLKKLELEWLQHKSPLLEQLEKERNVNNERRKVMQELVNKMKQLREETPILLQRLQDKQQQAGRLLEELRSLPNINRNEYTKRIMDIIAQIGEQDKNIARITYDIRELQRAVKNTTESVERADALAEEKIYRTAKSNTTSGKNKSISDESALEAYRKLKSFRSTFQALVTTVGEVGQQRKAASELTTRIEQEEQRINRTNLDRVKGDLNNVKIENKELMKKLQQVQKGKG